MPRAGWFKRLYRVLRPGLRQGRKGYAHARGARIHVIILDGTMASLEPDQLSNAGLAFNLLSEIAGARLSLYYEAGLQWQDWRATRDVANGRGLNRQIRRAYGFLASRYHPGDKIILLGFSRGAYAVRSLAGVIDRVGLLRGPCATERNTLTAYRHYRTGGHTRAARAFAQSHCHEGVDIEMVGVWDTVKALGLRLPLLWRLTEPAHAFHTHALGRSIRHGYHALALDETRAVYTPILWSVPDGFTGHVEQVWFRGNHSDIGGHLKGFEEARPLANIPFVWMMRRLEDHGVHLPEGWASRFPMDAQAPSSGNWRGWSKLFLARGKRAVGRDRSERLHESVAASDLREVSLTGTSARLTPPAGS